MVHHLTATGRRLPYGITVLPVTRHKRTHPTLTPAMQAGTRFTYPGGMDGWLARLQQADCHRGEVLTESRPRLPGTTMRHSDRTLHVLLDHLRD